MKKMVMFVMVFGFFASFTRAVWSPIQVVADKTGEAASNTVNWLNNK